MLPRCHTRALFAPAVAAAHVRLRRGRSSSLVALRIFVSLGVVALSVVGQNAEVSLPLSVPSVYDTLPCGKVFRVAFHSAPPFIDVDTSACRDQKCPASAFGDDGGLTYEFITKDLLTALKQMCKDRGEPTDIHFDWYLPASDRTLQSSAVEMVCLQSFSPGGLDGTTTNTSAVNRCAAYQGPSKIGTCNFIGDPTCTSSGPDFAAGSIHVSASTSQLLSLTSAFYNFKQVVVKRPAQQPDLTKDLLNVFAAFSGELWFYIMLEICVVWLLLLGTEGPFNDECLEGGKTLFFDCFYWSFTTMLAGVDKDAVTIGGKIVFIGHLFFCFILCATYTGAISAFLTQAAEGGRDISGFRSLSSGAFSVAAIGPMWDSSDPKSHAYHGALAGGNSMETIAASPQFGMMQHQMAVDPKSFFKFFMTKRAESRQTETEETPLIKSLFIDPCSYAGAVFGLFDMVACAKVSPQDKAGTGPAGLVYDEPLVIHELNGRYQRTGSCSLVMIGDKVKPMGYALAFPFSAAATDVFSRAIVSASYGGTMTRYKARYRVRAQDAMCVEKAPEGGDVMDVRSMSGLLISVSGLMLLALLFGCFEKGQVLQAMAEGEREASGLTLKQRRALKAKGLATATDLQLEEETLEDKHRRVTSMLEALAEDFEGEAEGEQLLLIDQDGRVDKDHVRKLFNHYDADKSGFIDPGEISEMCARVHKLQQRQQAAKLKDHSADLLKLLSEMDSDGDCLLSEQELEDGLQKWIDEILASKEELEEDDEELEHDDIDLHLEAMLTKMSASCHSIEALTCQLDPTFEVDTALSAPHPYTVSFAELKEEGNRALEEKLAEPPPHEPVEANSVPPQTLELAV